MSIGKPVYKFEGTLRGRDKSRYTVEVRVERCKVTNPEQRTVDLEPVAEGKTYLTVHVGFHVTYPHCREPQEWNHDFDRATEQAPAFKALCEIGRRWNNADLHAGTRAQRAVLDEYQRANPDARLEYDLALQVLGKAGLQTDRGYTYGNWWLIELPPADLLKRVKAACTALPTKKGRAA